MSSNPPAPSAASVRTDRSWSVDGAAPPRPALTPPTGSSSETGSATGEAAIGVGASVTGARVGAATVGATALRAVVGTASKVACVVLDADVAESVGRVAPTTVLAEREPGATVDVAVPTSVEDVAGARSEAVVDGEVVVVCAKALLAAPNTARQENAPTKIMGFGSLRVDFAQSA